MSHPYLLPPASDPLFAIGQTVRHMKTGGSYLIKELPTRLRIEKTGEPAYEYQDVVTLQKWVRPQTEMEDGRFEFVT